MELVKIATGEPITREQIEAAQLALEKELALPYDLTGVDLSGFGAVAVQSTEQPATQPGEVAERDGVEKIGGVWRQKWAVRPMTAAEKKALVPQVVTRRQALLALDSAGLLDDAEALIVQLPRSSQIEWNEAAEFRRDHPLIAGIGAQLNLDEDAIDALFIEAGGI